MDGYGRVLAEDNEFTLHDLVVLDTASAVQWGAANNDTSIMHRAYPALAPLRSAAADAVQSRTTQPVPGRPGLEVNMARGLFPRA